MSTSAVEKVSTGITGLDEVLHGGLPRGRATLLVGEPGAGKTVVASAIAVESAAARGEPVAYFSFEETRDELRRGLASRGHDPDDLEARALLHVEHVATAPAAAFDSGSSVLSPLQARVLAVREEIDACMVLIDGIGHVFDELANRRLARAEAALLLSRLKEQGVTVVLTRPAWSDAPVERLPDVVLADCVLRLDHRVDEQASTRRLRVLKYRGSQHEADEFPFLIERDGVSVFPVTSIRLDYDASEGVIFSGVPDLDAMLGAGGYPVGASVLVTGGAGSGKSSLAASFVAHAVAAGERAYYISAEQSPDVFFQHMRSIGIDLAAEPAGAGELTFHGERASHRSLEGHLSSIMAEVDRIGPSVLVLDPVSSFTGTGTSAQVQSMLGRLIHFLRRRAITVLLTHLTPGIPESVEFKVAISSLCDMWLDIRLREDTRARGPELLVVKARGMSHDRTPHILQFGPTGLSLSRE